MRRCGPALLAASALLATACSFAPTRAPAIVYSLAPIDLAAPAQTLLPPTLQVSAPPWLDGTAMLYRLDYADAAELSSYRDSRWAAPPAALFAERLRQRAARQARPVGAAGATGSVSLRIALEDFSQTFSAPDRSRARLQLRASVVDPSDGHVLRQQAFAVEVNAESADARGGAHAMSRAADAAIAQVLAWAAQR